MEPRVETLGRCRPHCERLLNVDRAQALPYRAADRGEGLLHGLQGATWKPRRPWGPGALNQKTDATGL
eukprot:13618188-Alexandrium_andersonii.AAC.1